MRRLGWIVAVLGCGHTTPARLDASATADASAITDASAAVDASASAIAACEAAVAQVRKACVDTGRMSDRICIYDALLPLCSTGRTDFVEAMFNCLLLDACQSPSDPSDAATCESNLVTMSATDADKAAGAFQCGCESTPEQGCTSNLPYESLGYYMMLKPADLAALVECGMTSGCTATSCLAASPLSGLAACQ